MTGMGERLASLRGRGARQLEAVRLALGEASTASVVREVLLLLAVGAVSAVSLDVTDGQAPPLSVWWMLPLGAVLLARWVWPTAALVAANALAFLPFAGGLVCMVVVAFAAGRRVRSRRRLWTAVVAVSLAVSAILAVGEHEDPPGEMFLAGLALTGIIVVLPAVCGVVRGRRRPLIRLLSERNDYLERTRELAAVQARRDERVRITGEMHDMLGHRLSLLSMHAGALELRAAQDAPALGEQVRFVRSTAVAAMQELRQILQLTPGPAAAAPPGTRSAPGTRDDVEAVVEESRRAGSTVGFDWQGANLAQVDPRTGQAVHRVVREGLTNAHKHAPGAPSVRVAVETLHLDREDGRVRVRVVNGPPAAPAASGPGTRRGLVGLEERVTLLGGTLRAGPTADGGYELVADVPAQPSAAVPVPDLGSTPLPGPPPVRGANVMTVWRALAVVALALVVPVLTALAFFAVLPR